MGKHSDSSGSRNSVKIKGLIENIVAMEEPALKNNYADTFMDDSWNEYFVINPKNRSQNVGMGIKE